MNKIFSFIIILIIYLILDGLMIFLYMGKTFGSMIKKIQNGQEMKVRIIPALLAFVVLAFGINHFIIDKIRDNNIILDSAKYAIPFGFVIYAVYDFTNLATFKDYSIQTAIIDMVWGSVLAFLVTISAKFIMKKGNLTN